MVPEGIDIMCDIEKLLAPYVDLSLECDGLARVIVYLLDQNKIPYQLYVGTVSVNNVEFPIHYWVVLDNGHYLDYRLRMWFRNEKNVPHGIFNIEDVPHVQYNGTPIEMSVSDVLFTVLTTVVGKNIGEDQ